MSNKSKSVRKRKISDKGFADQFTKIVSAHLASLPPDEQDKRIQRATRTVTNGRRASVSTKTGASDTGQVAHAARSRE